MTDLLSYFFVFEDATALLIKIFSEKVAVTSVFRFYIDAVGIPLQVICRHLLVRANFIILRNHNKERKLHVGYIAITKARLLKWITTHLLFNRYIVCPP